MKKSLYLFSVLTAVLLSGCKGAPESRVSESVLEQFDYGTAEQSAPETAENSDNETTERSREMTPKTGEQESPESALDSIPYVDENGLITQEGMERIAAIAGGQDTPSSADYTGLFDFDRDGGRYLNINYTIEVQINDVPAYIHENHYKTFMIQNQVTQIDKGRGVYYASING
ncbi:MAG: hypothetical protein K2O14_15295 [Oscillospiraceae bacterium]|nr:hypothetical protein [Oscillospiraceae bacterium]